MNRNTKRYPQEEIISLKKRGKRLRGGYLLAKLKNWKSSGTKPEIDRPKTIKPKPLTTKRKTEPKQKIEAKGRAIPKSIEVKPIKAKKTIAKQPKQKVEAKGRAIPKSIEIKPVEKKVRKTRQKSVNKVVVEKIKQAEQKPVESKNIDMVMVKLAYDKWEENIISSNMQNSLSLYNNEKWQKELSEIFLNNDIITIYNLFNSPEKYIEQNEIGKNIKSVVTEKFVKRWGSLKIKQEVFLANFISAINSIYKKIQTEIDKKTKKYYSIKFLGNKKYTVSFSGEKLNRDGSPQLEMQIFSNKKAADRFMNKLEKDGYLYSSSLADNFNPNTEQELQAIAKDIPAFGDDVNEEKFDVDGKYNLPEVVQKRDNMEVASVKDIKTMRFKALTLPSKYRQLLGKVPANFRMLLWGSPGHGKSSLALTIANDIGKFVKTLYVSAEESLQSATLSSRIKRFKANARNLMFNDSNNPDILDRIIMTQNPKFVVIDSVNVMIGKTEAIINLMLKYPEVGFIIIAQATKDRKKYAGLGSLAHAVDIVVNVRSGMAVAEKNRYAQLGSMPVKGIKI
jgi:hypothetical protein